MEIDAHHRLASALQLPSPNTDDRPEGEVSLVVIHNISLPAGHFGSSYVEQLFLNELDCSMHPDFVGLDGVRVSSHLLIRRSGQVVQFAPFNKRAWHAGESVFNGRSACNDFSIGIELEGTDTHAYTDLQYETLADVCLVLATTYPIRDYAGHADIAPGRKTDPGPSFDWQRFRSALGTV